MHFFGLWEKAGVRGENPGRHSENMQTPRGKAHTLELNWNRAAPLKYKKMDKQLRWSLLILSVIKKYKSHKHLINLISPKLN